MMQNMSIKKRVGMSKSKKSMLNIFVKEKENWPSVNQRVGAK
jgi:hypothetical protein